MRFLSRLGATGLVCLALPAYGQTDTTAKPGGSTTTLPLTYTRSAKFTTDEGTWMSVDVSKDGLIVFDLAGDLYTLPLTGGKATRITDGPGYDAQPRFAPDGKTILFQSDRNGSENLYSVTIDGKTVTALTTTDNDEYLSPAWSPDGNYFFASKTGYNTLGAYTLHMYPKAGGAPIQVSGAGPQGGGIPGGNILGTAFGPDPRYLYYVSGGSWGYNLTSFAEWGLNRFDLVTGEVKELVSYRAGGAFRPVLSPDGQWLVYGTRRDTATSLRARNLKADQEGWLIDNVQRDDMESRFTRDILPGYAFTPDSKAIVIAFNGKLWRVEVPSGKATMIPFTADVDVQLGELIKFDYPINDSTLTVTQIREPRLSPDNKKVVFVALDRVYVMDLPNGAPRRLTKDSVIEMHPVWSPDGQWIAYATWNDSTGHVYRVKSDGSAAPELVSKTGGSYGLLNYSPNGGKILVNRSKPGQYWGGALVWFPASGGEATVISESKFGFPYFINSDSSRIYIGTGSFRWDGLDDKQELKSGNAVMFSPDGKYVYSIRQPYAKSRLTLTKLPFIRALPLATITAGSPTVTRQISEPAVSTDFIAFSNDASKMIWTTGRFLFIYDIPLGDSLTADSVAKAEAKKTAKPDSAKPAGDTTKPATPANQPAYKANRIEIKIQAAKDRPAGVIALRNARIITAKGDEVIETGDIVITDNRITAIGRTGTVTIPANAKVMDLRGRTIMPGMVDIHAHPGTPEHTVQPWTYAAGLAYGVTTIRDPSTGLEIFAYQDLVEAGEMLGPRIFSTGPALLGPGYGGEDNLTTLDMARDAVRLYSEYYETKTLKQYLTGTRKTRQFILQASKEFKITPTLEGGLDFKKNITEAIDGYAGSEHSYPITPLYKDMVEIIAKSGITYTPTLLVAYGGPWTENYYYQKYADMHDNNKLRRFVPHRTIDSKFLRSKVWFNDKLYAAERISAQAAKIVNAGGRVGLGGHGQLTGLGEHFELWAIQSGGMRPIDAIKCATIFGAEAVGLGKDLGSLEVGKLADLVVLDKNPLVDIKNTLSIKYVMKNGRLYDGETLDEVYPRIKPFKRLPWLEEDEVIPVQVDLDPDPARQQK